MRWLGPAMVHAVLCGGSGEAAERVRLLFPKRRLNKPPRVAYHPGCWCSPTAAQAHRCGH